MISTSYPSGPTDWKGLFIRNLVEAASRLAEIDLSLWAPPGDRPCDVESALGTGDGPWLSRLMEKGGIAHALRTAPIRNGPAVLNLLWRLRRAYRRDPRPDVHHVNWLQNALALPPDSTPVLLTALGTDMKLLGLPLMRRALRKVLARRPAMICPNADWMVEPLRDAFGDVAQVRCNPFGIAPEWFDVPRDPGGRLNGWRWCG